MKRTIRILSLLLIGSMASGQANAQELRTNHGNSSEVKGAVQVYTPLSDEQRGGGAPTNDLCSGAVDNALAVGGTLSLSGDNTGATDESGVGFQIVYEQFTITTCADITLNYCVAGSEFTNFLINLTTSCPDILVGLLTATSYDNCTATFLGLPAGTYLIPVLADGIDTPAGAYTMEVTASACDTYCAASAVSANFEVINNVQFGGIDNPTATTNGYENYTDIVGEVATGNSYPITVENTDGYDTDLVMVWIDLDHSGSFETSEMVYTSEAGVGPYTGQIAIPADALLGQTRMRLRLQDSTFNNNLTPCGTHQYGQVQDYTLNITTGVGMQEIGAEQFGLYPNPNDGNFSVVLPKATGKMSVEVVDVTGRVVFATTQQATGNEPLLLELAGKLAKGGYLLRITTADAQFADRMIVR
ncbi:MAG: T9SS type A sorting domain-containing protein [Flavobacteriales bacterium]|nr:T9SS type A sorting domain-containing protein [Flavobacteriales bacterium]